MRLNHDCVRALMLYLEENLDYTDESLDVIDIDSIEIKGFKKSDIVYSAKKLSEAEYITAEFLVCDLDDLHAHVSDITWEGHKFLDTIRDNKVWANTKSILSKVSSCSISFASTVASQVLATLIQQQLGTGATPWLTNMK